MSRMGDITFSRARASAIGNDLDVVGNPFVDVALLPTFYTFIH